MAGEFVGRQHRLAVVCDALDRVERHQGCTIVVAGEAGIGKSRFAREAAALGRARDMDVVWAAGWPSGGAPAYWPWPQVLGALDPSEGDALTVAPGAAETERFGRFRGAADVLWRRAADRPLLVVVDDVHTLDADGLLFTRFVAHGTAGHRVVLVLTQRTGADVAPHAVELLDEITGVGIVCRLEALSSDEIGQLIEVRGAPAEVRVVQRVRELTGGVPFLIEQVLDAGLHHRPGPIPDPARRLTEARLRGLTPTERAVVEAAAVLGTPFVSVELADVSDADLAAVQTACTQAATLGLLRADGPTRFVFVHELAREAVIASLGPSRLAELQGRCLAILDDGATSVERSSRRAHHALARAACSTEHVAAAIVIARESARHLGGHGSPEAAVELLGAALDLHQGTQPMEVAPLLVELGDALVATGRLGASRDVFRRAVNAAMDVDDAATLARAALGLGGVWVHEHRTADTWREYTDLVGRAIDQIRMDPSPDARALCADLQLRLTAERAAVGDAEPDEVVVALDGVRNAGSPRDVLSGLSLLHHMMLGPQHAHERVAVADELVEMARACGDDLHLVMGLLWRAVDDVLLGRDADRALGELRARADALGMRAILFVLDAIDVMRQLRAGDLVEAEASAVACHERGVEVGDADAETYFAAHILGIHWYRGTAGDLLGLAQAMAASSSTPANNPVFTATTAALAAAAGDVDAAERALSALGRDELKKLLTGSTWLVTMFTVVEAAVNLEDVGLAEQAYELLRPYEHLPTMAAIGVCCFGSTARTLGLAARVTGRFDDAVAHLEQAVSENQRLGNRPMTAIARADLAETLMARRRPGDRARALQLIARALEGGTQIGLTGRLDGWTGLQARIERDDIEASASLERADDGWLIAASGERARIAPTSGMDYLAKLLASPRIDITVGALVGLDLVSPPQELLDASARHALGRRIADLESAVDVASLRGDTDEEARVQHELDELLAHVRSAVGPTGRSRRFDDANERARTSVQKAIRRAIATIGRDCPELADTLARSVKTGFSCRYEPAADAPERWDVRAS
jgi:tetratricopeptide (TPR) repeat protein